MITYTSDNVGCGVVANHIDVGWKLLLAMELLHPAGHDFVGILVRGQLRLAIDNTLKFLSGESLVHCLKTNTEGTLRHAWGGVLSRTKQVTLGKVNGDALGERILGLGVQEAVLGLQEIHDDLHVGGIVAGVGEDHDGVDAVLREVERVGGLALLVREDAVWCDRWVPGDNIVGYHNVLETVLLSDLTAAVSLSANNKDGLVVLSQSTHGRVGLNKLLCADRLVKDLRELLASWCLRLSRTVCEKDVWNLDSKLVVAIQDLKGTLSLWNQSITVNQYTVDVENESHVLGELHSLAGQVLDLRGQDFASGLDWRHAWPRGAAIGVGD